VISPYLRLDSCRHSSQIDPLRGRSEARRSDTQDERGVGCQTAVPPCDLVCDARNILKATCGPPAAAILVRTMLVGQERDILMTNGRKRARDLSKER